MRPNKALLGTRHKVSGPQNADVQIFMHVVATIRRDAEKL